MTLSLSAQQISFYAKNGFIELEELFSPVSSTQYLSLILETLNLRRQKLPIETDYVRGRDLWRDSPELKTLLCSKKLSKLALAASGKPALRLACDQWFEPGYLLEKPQKLKDLFSIQGLACAIFMQLHTEIAKPVQQRSPLGLFPFPQKQGSVLLFNPSLLVNWPEVNPKTGLYLAIYTLPTSVYIQNGNDPAGGLIRQYGYGYGDLIRNDTHPLLARS